MYGDQGGQFLWDTQTKQNNDYWNVLVERKWSAIRTDDGVGRKFYNHWHCRIIQMYYVNQWLHESMKCSEAREQDLLCGFGQGGEGGDKWAHCTLLLETRKTVVLDQLGSLIWIRIVAIQEQGIKQLCCYSNQRSELNQCDFCACPTVGYNWITVR